jgi:hypothetical protein
MQSFIQSCLTRSALLGVLVGTTFVGFCGVGGGAIAIQPKNAAPAAVKPSHWAFQSLNSLIEQYGCVVVSPSGLPFQALPAPTRYEMAAVLDGCLDQIADRFETTEDRLSAQALQKEFKRETEIFWANTGSFKGRPATLEAQQFSTINHPVGEVVYFSPFPGLLLEPTHWSFQSVQSLIERYQCILNAPDTPNRNSSATSRYEMAALISTCLNRIGDRFANQKDLETAQALQKEFKSELTALKDRVDFLENRAATLEPQQFSTTTKLQGQAVVTFQGGGFR